EGQSVAEIFRDKGEAHFRKLEKALVDELPSENAVIACGGGLPCYNNLLENIKQNGVVVYLKGNPDQLYKRISTHTNRPLLSDINGFRLLLKDREAWYENADVVVSAEASLNDVLVNILLETNSKIKEER
ncbi:MAG: shikimate kinase, partial [Sphingomonadales bacterium]